MATSTVTTTKAVPYNHDPIYLTLTRMLERFSFLILLTPTSSPKLDRNLAHLQSQTQQELHQSLPYHRTKWLRSIESARTLLLKLEQTAQNIKVQRTRQTLIRDLAEKRMSIKRLKSKVEEIGRDVDSGSYYNQTQEDDSETLYDILQQVRRSKGQIDQDPGPEPEQKLEETKEKLFETDTQMSSSLRQRKKDTESNGFKDLQKTEDSLMTASATHESITRDLLSMAAQLKQQSMAFQFSLDQDKGFVDRAVEGLEGNMNAMGIASRGMKTLQRMSEEEGWFGRLKLQLMIAGLWVVALLIVFVGPKLRF